MAVVSQTLESKALVTEHNLIMLRFAHNCAIALANKVIIPNGGASQATLAFPGTWNYLGGEKNEKAWIRFMLSSDFCFDRLYPRPTDAALQLHI